MIPTRDDPHFFHVHRFISGPLEAKYSIQRNSVMENNKNKAYAQLRYRTKPQLKHALEIYVSVIQTNPEYAE